MGHRLSKIYTRTGDAGSTGLGDGARVGKDDLRVMAMGDVDELNAIIGILRAQIANTEIASKLQWDGALSHIQHWLFDLGGEICIPSFQLLKPSCIEQLEQQIDQINSKLPMLKEFILPYGHLCCCYAHQARSVCRRAERSLVALQQRDQNLSETALILLNRLSDWLFVASRALQHATDGKEVMWQKNLETEQFNML